MLSGNSAPIMGRNWLVTLGIIKINKEAMVITIKNVKDNYSIEELLIKYKDVFNTTIGKCSTHKLTLF